MEKKKNRIKLKNNQNKLNIYEIFKYGALHGFSRADTKNLVKFSIPRFY